MIEDTHTTGASQAPFALAFTDPRRPEPLDPDDQGHGYEPPPTPRRMKARTVDDLRRALAEVTTPCDAVEIYGELGPVRVLVWRQAATAHKHTIRRGLERTAKRLGERVDGTRYLGTMAEVGRIGVALVVTVG